LALKVLETACWYGGERLRIQPKWPVAIRPRSDAASSCLWFGDAGGPSRSVNDCGAGSSVICDEAFAALAGRTCDQASGNSI